MNQKELLWISVSIFLTIIAWMFIDIYKVKVNTASMGATVNMSSTVNVKIDQKILNILKEKTP